MLVIYSFFWGGGGCRNQALKRVKEERDAAVRQTQQLQQELVTVSNVLTYLLCHFQRRITRTGNISSAVIMGFCMLELEVCSA